MSARTPKTLKLRHQLNVLLIDADDDHRKADREAIGATYRELVADAMSDPIRGELLRWIAAPLRREKGRLHDVRVGDATLLALIVGRPPADFEIGAAFVDVTPTIGMKAARDAARYSWNAIGSLAESSLLRLLTIDELAEFFAERVESRVPRWRDVTDEHFVFATDDEWDPNRVLLAATLAHMSWSDIYDAPELTHRIARALSPYQRHALLVSSRPANPAVLLRVFGDDQSSLKLPA